MTWRGSWTCSIENAGGGGGWEHPAQNGAAGGRVSLTNGGGGLHKEGGGVREINGGDLYWVVKMILRAVGALVRLRGGGQMGWGLQNSKSSCGARFRVCR